MRNRRDGLETTGPARPLSVPRERADHGRLIRRVALPSGVPRATPLFPAKFGGGRQAVPQPA
jgi:hypothetical protein